ncbi:hypothetical protein P171DRAFT_434066 [Karstenula rhodostoma CBS 690.94]|uniref:Uncharacterized protein n=1 Tax=Karstenula rhodostoma CBS 690.94 TaxID=1392251 RepID=A0A9P4PED9_9PLEO|nr:hypothetical protein P171DRAFT_434066 [Karstenula rhodostoma CBS 690.94]
MPNQTSSSASSTSSKNTKTQNSQTRSGMTPISTMGQGQALLLAQATLPAQAEERVVQEGEDASLSEKRRSRPSMRSALSSIKDTAKRLSFSSSASGKDDATLVGKEEKEEKRKA